MADERPEAASPAATSAAFTSSLGVPFVEIPGTPVLFAAWETRVRDFATFVRESDYTWDFKADFTQSEDHPVVNVTLRDAIAFCTWLTARERKTGKLTPLQSYRLPTRREWDAAAGLASGRKETPLDIELERDKQRFPWGLDWPPPAHGGNLNMSEIAGTDDGYVYTAPVGKFDPNAEGVYDLAGNVWEWTWDRETQSEAVGVLRGGAWNYFRKECLLAEYQYEVPAILRASTVGFRCVLEDKQRAAAFLARARGSTTDTPRAGGELNPTSPSARGEAKLAREQMERKMSASTTPAAPDLAKLKPAVVGASYANSLGMTLRPLEGSPSLLMGETEVRVRDYQTALGALGRTWERKPTFAIGELHPVVNVSWLEAVQFCDWLTDRERKSGLIPAKGRYRLPTDLEWSRAAGLVDESRDSPASRHLVNRTERPWGTDTTPPPRSANLDTARMEGYTDNFSHTAPVGSFSPSRTGFYDLAGNVAEWCDDAWPGSPGERVIRGSSWLTSNAEGMLTSYRQHLAEGLVRPDTGFRVVLDLGE